MDRQSIIDKIGKLGLGPDESTLVREYLEGDVVGVRAYMLSLAAGRAHQACGAASAGDNALAQLISEDVMDLTALALDINPLTEGSIA